MDLDLYTQIFFLFLFLSIRPMSANFSMHTALVFWVFFYIVNI